MDGAQLREVTSELLWEQASGRERREGERTGLREQTFSITQLRLAGRTEGARETHHCSRIVQRRVLLGLAQDPPERPLVPVLVSEQLDVVDVGLRALLAGGSAHRDPGVAEGARRGEEVGEAEAREGLDRKVRVVRRDCRGERGRAVRGTAWRSIVLKLYLWKELDGEKGDAPWVVTR